MGKTFVNKLTDKPRKSSTEIADRGLSVTRDAVISLMEHVPELCALHDEEWYAVEDELTAAVDEIVKRVSK